MSTIAAALELALGARPRLEGRHLLEQGLFSVRAPGQEALAALEPGGEMRVLSFREAAGDPAAALHALAYRQRPDVGAVLTAAPPWCAALAGLDRALPPVFDEQMRHLGGAVVHLGRRERLDAVRNAWFRPGGCLVLGTTRDRAVFNAELLEKCAQAYLLAFLAGGRIRRLPLPVRLVAGHRLRRDERAAAAALAAGTFAETATAY